jgi:G protein-coupled glucose receptor regulating Gpa2 C-term
MAVYPLIYVICTLPLASARTAAMAGRNVPMSYLLFAGAMITSNGWLDCLLYALTRRILIFSDDPPSEDCGLETFALPWTPITRFGTTTTITAGGNDLAGLKGSVRSRFGLSRKASLVSWRSSTSSTAPIYTGGGGSISRNTSVWDKSQSDVMGGLVSVPSMEAKKEMTVMVTHETVQMEDLQELEEIRERNERKAVRPLRLEDMELDFESKPSGI